MSKGLMMGLIGAMLLLFVGVAGLGYMVFMRPVAAAPAPVEHKERSAEAEQSTVAFLKLKNFVTDLADKERARYVDVTIAVGVKDAEALTAAKAAETQIRDVILTQLRSRTAADLSGAQGKDKLVETLKEPLNKALNNTVKAIHITDLVVQ